MQDNFFIEGAYLIFGIRKDVSKTIEYIEIFLND